MIHSAIGTQLPRVQLRERSCPNHLAHPHEKIWARPMTTLSGDVGVSGRGLAKSAGALDYPGAAGGSLGKASKSCAADRGRRAGLL
jgi:hypothetical protein